MVMKLESISNNLYLKTGWYLYNYSHLNKALISVTPAIQWTDILVPRSGKVKITENRIFVEDCREIRIQMINFKTKENTENIFMRIFVF